MCLKIKNWKRNMNKVSKKKPLDKWRKDIEAIKNDSLSPKEKREIRQRLEPLRRAFRQIDL